MGQLYHTPKLTVLTNIFFSERKGKWFCTPSCAKGYTQNTQGTDSVQEYTRFTTWLGLLILAHHDAERENDGPAMLNIWKVAQIGFVQNNNNKYLALAHRLLTGKMFHHQLCFMLTMSMYFIRTSFIVNVFATSHIEC